MKKIEPYLEDDPVNMQADARVVETDSKNQVALGLHKFKNTPIIPSKKGLKKLSKKEKEKLSKIENTQELADQLDKTL